MVQIKESTARRTTRNGLVLAALAVLMTLSFTGWAYFNHVIVEKRLTTVTAGWVYSSGTMNHRKLQEVCRNLQIRTVVDFRTADRQPEIDAEKRVLSNIGVKHVNIPSEQIPSDHCLEQFLSILQDNSNYPLLLHCYHGKGRAVLYSALYRIEMEGWSNDRARNACRLFVEDSAFDTDYEKGLFLHNYHPRLR